MFPSLPWSGLDLGQEIPVLEWEWDGVGRVGFSACAPVTSEVGFLVLPVKTRLSASRASPPQLLLERLSQLIPSSVPNELRYPCGLSSFVDPAASGVSWRWDELLRAGFSRIVALGIPLEACRVWLQ